MSGEHEESDHWAAILTGIIDALGAAGVIDPDAVRGAAEGMLHRDGHPNAQRIVARAWVDDEFRERLLKDGNAVREVLGFDMTDGFLPDLVLRVVANSMTEHNVIVCTLCSCYPVAVLGPPPAWYKSEAYRSRVVIEPRSVLAEFGVRLPSETRVTVWDSTSEVRYMVLPERPSGTTGWSEERLAELVTPESIVGTGLVVAMPHGAD